MCLAMNYVDDPLGHGIQNRLTHGSEVSAGLVTQHHSSFHRLMLQYDPPGPSLLLLHQKLYICSFLQENGVPC